MRWVNVHNITKLFIQFETLLKGGGEIYQVLLTFFRFGKLLNEIKIHYVLFVFSTKELWTNANKVHELMQTKYIPLLVDTSACMYYRITRTRTSWQTKSKTLNTLHISTRVGKSIFCNFASFWLHKVKLHIIKGMCNIIQPAAFSLRYFVDRNLHVY